MESVQTMASSSSSTVPSSDLTSHFSSQTEMEMESSKARHWSQLDYSTTESEWSAETNFNDFSLLKKDPECGRFFRDFEALEVGARISGGAQADIYEARNKRDGPYNLVVKVMKGDVPLKTFQAQWPIGMLSARSKDNCVYSTSLITILGGTLLCDERLRGRFAFVMFRRWGDLRLLIDRRMKQERRAIGPFSIDKAIDFMLSVAEDMDTLHNYDILHRDLKASNVLVWGEFGKDISLIAPPGQVERLGTLVADFECSVGVLGTGFWRAPEILEQLKARVPSSEVLFTRASDVYSYGMTCYEIVTGGIPFDGRGGKDTISQILNGVRPELPHELPEFVRHVIVGCWHSDPLERPTFSAICEALKLKRGLERCSYPESVVIDNKSGRGANIVKVQQWNNFQALTLLEAMERLIDMDLSVLKASDSSPTERNIQYFEVTDCEGRKVWDDESIANIRKALSWAAKGNWQSGSVGTSIDGNSTVQMHVVEVVAERSVGLLWTLSRHLVATNFRVHSAGCWTRDGRVECVIYIEGARLGTLLWKLRHEKEHCMFDEVFKIVVHRVAAGRFPDLKSRLQNLKSVDLTRTSTTSNIRVHQRKDLKEFQSTEVVVCLAKGCRVLDMSASLGRMAYKIVAASVEYRGPYKFPKGRVNKREEIDVGTLGEDESENMIRRILDIATERGCSPGDGQLIVSGGREQVHDDLLRSLHENDLVVTGGQVYRRRFDSDDRDGDLVLGGKVYRRRFDSDYFDGDLVLFVTEKAAGES